MSAGKGRKMEIKRRGEEIIIRIDIGWDAQGKNWKNDIYFQVTPCDLYLHLGPTATAQLKGFFLTEEKNEKISEGNSNSTTPGICEPVTGKLSEL